MKSFGFLSFGHYGAVPGSQVRNAQEMLHQTVELAVGADDIGVNGAYLRVHHWARQAASPMPLLTAMAMRTKRIEVGTGVIDLRYENPYYLAEEAATVDLLSNGRLALGVSRGSPETALRGYEVFGYEGEDKDRGSDIAHAHFKKFLEAIDGTPIAPADPLYGGANQRLAIEPRSASLRNHLWWGSGKLQTAEWAGRLGLNLMSSTLISEADGSSFSDLQADQIDRYRRAYREAGHTGTPRVSVSRSVFPLVNDLDHRYFGYRGDDSNDQIGMIDGHRSTFGKTYAAEPDELVEQLRRDPAVMSADTLMLTIPNQLGVDYNLHVLESFAKYVAPELGWQPNTQGPATGYPIAA